MRPGCPISAILFILVAEVLAISIRNDPNIKGIKVDETEFKIAMLADDTTLFLADINSLKQAIITFKKFSKISGLNINIEKTEVIPLGNTDIENIGKIHSLKHLKLNYNAFKTLGIWFSKNEEESLLLNFNEKIKNIQKLINIWHSRNLSLKGKVTIIKALLLPKIYHLLSTIYIPNIILKQIDKTIFEFLWNKKTPKVKKDSIISNIEDGGLKMPDIYAIHDSFKISWIKKLFDNEKGKWKILTWKLINIKAYQFNMKMKEIPTSISKYHNQLLHIWFKYKSIYPNDIKDILNEYLLHNKHILIGNNTLTHKNSDVQIPNKTKLLDIIDNNGNIITLLEFNVKFNTNLTIMNYNKIISAIPKKWKTKIQEIKPNMIIKNLNYNNNFYLPNLKIKDTLRDINSLKTKEITQEIINRIKKPLTVLDTWIEIYPFLETLEWAQIFKLPYKIVMEPYLQTFQYKIINRITNCNYNLAKWKIKDSSYCNECIDTNDTIEHHLYFCPSVREFWKQTTDWIDHCLKIKYNFTVCGILLGIPFNKNEHLLHATNYLILIGKLFINGCRTKNKQIFFGEFKANIISRLKVLEFVYKSQNKENEFNNIFETFIE